MFYDTAKEGIQNEIRQTENTKYINTWLEKRTKKNMKTFETTVLKRKHTENENYNSVKISTSQTIRVSS